MQVREILCNEQFAYGKITAISELLNIPHGIIKLASDDNDGVIEYLIELADSLSEETGIYAIFKHSDGRAMSVELTVDDDSKPITITRTWEKKGKDIVANSSISPAVYDTKGIVGSLELPVFNFNEFVGMTANKLKEWFMNFLPAVDAEIDWDYELSNLMTSLLR